MKFFALALSFLLTACSAQSDAPQVTLGVIVGCDALSTISNSNEMPATELPCLTESGLTSEKYALNSIQGPFIINVWGSWCTACMEELPYFVELNATKVVQIIGLDVEEAKASDAITFAKKHGMAWPQIHDPNSATRGDFGMGVPVTWFVDKNGHVTNKKVGQIHSFVELKGLLKTHLGISA
ncbi:MAG: TlpA disulfide reductase family protein [Actinomycetes bacterium]